LEWIFGEENELPLCNCANCGQSERLRSVYRDKGDLQTDIRDCIHSYSIVGVACNIGSHSDKVPTEITE
jgi:hypothetical protein